VDDAGFVSGGEAFEELVDDVRGVVGLEAPELFDAAAEVLAVEELHDHVELARGEAADVEDLADVLGADEPSGLGFLLEAPDEVLFCGERGVEDLDGDAA